MYNRINILVFLVFISQLIACKKDSPTVTKAKYENGVFIVNEGQFNAGNGAIDYYNPDNDSLELDIFKKVNGRPLGDIVQSLHFHNGQGYIVVNNSNKIEIVDGNSFISKAVIRNLALPRYCIGIDAEKAYISEWGDGFSGAVKVLDLKNNSISKTVSLNTNGAGHFLKLNNRIIVLSDGGFSTDSTLTEINTLTDNIIKTVPMHHNPNSIVQDKNQFIWLLCGGKKVYDANFNLIPALSTSSRLLYINPNTLQIVRSFNFTDVAATASNLSINSAADKLVYNYNGSVYSHDIDATLLPTTALIPNTYFYGLNTWYGYIFAADAGNFSSSGKMKIYNTSNGTFLKEFRTSIAPNGFVFK